MCQTVETLNFLRSGLARGKLLINRPAVKFEFIINPGMKGLSALSVENPLEKLEYERKQMPPPSAFLV